MQTINIANIFYTRRWNWHFQNEADQENWDCDYSRCILVTQIRYILLIKLPDFFEQKFNINEQ